MRYNPLKSAKEAKPPRSEPLPKGTIPNPAPVAHTWILSENEEKDGYELKYPTKPDEAVLKLFHATKELPKEQQWHWHFRKKFWYAKRNEVTKDFAAKICGRPIAPAPKEEGVKAEEEVFENNVIEVAFTSDPEPAQAETTEALPAWKMRFSHRTA